MRYPVFIVGSPRSGTSILVDSLLAAGYNGFREGNFLSVWNAIERVTDRHFEVFANGNPKVLVSMVDREALKAKLFLTLCHELERLNHEAPWFDKTGNPEMILSIPMLRRVWPESVFIFAKRRAIENIMSRVKKFPGLTFKYHCADWARTMAVWRASRERLAPETYVEIDQQSILQEPDAAAEAIARLLGLEQPSRAALARTFRTNRPQETERGSAQRLYGLEQTGWTKEQIEIFLGQCQEEMDAFHYTNDNTYWELPEK